MIWDLELGIYESPRMDIAIQFKLNGKDVQVEVPCHWTLLRLLREKLGLTGTKEGCGIGECGACTVLLDGIPVNSCLVLAPKVGGREVQTIEGLGSRESLHSPAKVFCRAWSSSVRLLHPRDFDVLEGIGG